MKKFVSVVLSLVVMCLIVSAKEYPQKFWDVSKDYWGFLYIADLADRGIINGYEDGTFKPEKTVSRSEWAKIMVQASGLKINDNSLHFFDMENHWANIYVNSAREFLTGYKDGSYRPDQAATREDVTVSIVKLKGYDLTDVDYSYLNKFTDGDSISNYAKGYVAVAVQNNLISGFDDNTFRGQNTLTRAEAATLLYKAFQHGNADKFIISEGDASDTVINKSAIMEAESTHKENEEDTMVEEYAEKKPYIADTLAEVSECAISMVVDKKGTVHYLSDTVELRSNDGRKTGNTRMICNTNGDKLNPECDLSYDIGSDNKNYDYSVTSVSLAYDEYNDIVYLIGNDTNKKLIIFDITDYQNPKVVLSKFNCKDIAECNIYVDYLFVNDVILPIEVLKNGAILLTDVDGDTYTMHGGNRFKLMVNPKTGAISRYEVKKDEMPNIEGGLIYKNGNNIVYKNDRIYFWNNDEGYVRIDRDGSRHILATVDDIEALDYKATNNFNIWNSVVGKDESFIFYDNSDKSIRIIKKQVISD